MHSQPLLPDNFSSARGSIQFFMSNRMEEKVYVFHGEGARFASGVFDNLETAEKWIKGNRLSGLLTVYPLNRSAYDWAVEKEFFIPKKEHHFSPRFIGGFTSASQEHYHYENGQNS